MTSSSNDPTTKSTASKGQPALSGDHWQELTETLSAESTAPFALWLDQDLALLEEQLDDFVTSGSLKKSLRR